MVLLHREVSILGSSSSRCKQVKRCSTAHWPWHGQKEKEEEAWWVRHPYKIIPLSGTASVLHVVFTQSFYHQQNGRGGLFVLLWQYSRASQPATSFSCLGVDVVVGVGNLGHFPLPLMSSHIINEQFLMKSFMLWIFNIPSLVVVVGMEWLRYSTTWIGPYLGCDSMPRFMMCRKL